MTGDPTVKCLENALRGSDEMFTRLFEMAPYSISISRIQDGCYLLVNEGFCKNTGYSKQEILGRSAADLDLYFDPADRDRLVQEIQRQGKVSDFEIRFKGKDGTLYYNKVTAQAIRHKGEDCILSVSTFLLPPHKVQKALHQSRERFRNIVENLAEGYYETDLQGNLTFFNEAVINALGYSREQLLGVNYRSYTSPESAEKVLNFFSETFETGGTGSILDYVIVKKDGTHVALETSANILRNAAGEPIGFYGIMRDRTEQKRAEEALRRSEENYRNILETMQEGYYEVDLTGRLTFFNSALCRLHGRSPEEMMGLENRSYMTEETAQRVYAAFNHVYRTGMATRIIDYEIFRKDGTVSVQEASVVLHKDNAGKPIGFRGVTRDRTQQRKAELALQESEQKYRSILEEMEEGYYETDLNGSFTYFNESTRRIYGHSDAELMGMNYRQYVSPETGKQINRLFRKIYQTGISARILDYEIFRKDGSICILEMSAYPSRDAAGRVVGFWGISRDRTERKQAEMALQESESRLRSIFENAAVGIAYYRIQGEFIRVNKGFCDLVGYSAEELAGMKAVVLTHPEDRRCEAEETAKLLSGKKKSYTLEKRLRCKDGATLWCRTTVSLALADQDQPMYFVAVLENITERKQATEALRHSEERYRLLVENANEGIYITQDGLIKFLNPKMEEVCGYTDQELINMPFVNLVHSEDRVAIYEMQQSRLEQRPGVFSFRIFNKNRETLWVELSTVGITWEGNPASLNFLRDITPQKKIEAQLLQAKKMEAIGTLAGGIAHDFNNLLMGIEGNASLMLLDMPPDHPHYKKLANIKKYIKAGADLTKQLLGSARGGKYEVRSTDLNKVIDISADLFGRTKKEITIHKKLSDGLWPVEVDRGQIEQVLLNLFVNAWHAMPSGGDLFLETSNAELDEYYVQPYGVAPGKFCKISVTDTGVGIDAQDQRRIFDPFFTTRAMGMGTGLGLSSAYGIIANHGGIINVYSEKGAGATFNIYLPATGKEVIEYEEPESRIQSGTETVLFVDDEAGIVDVSRLILQRLGYRVLTAQSGREAVEIYHERHAAIDLVILDMIMPGMSGSDTYNELKKIRPDVKVVLSSGYSINGQAKKILDRGCMGFIQKPFSMRDLSVKLRQILDTPLPEN
jgi:two-component system, cell cycle sensor histidine kinase and response regulator CckA